MSVRVSGTASVRGDGSGSFRSGRSHGRRSELRPRAMSAPSDRTGCPVRHAGLWRPQDRQTARGLKVGGLRRVGQGPAESVHGDEWLRHEPHMEGLTVTERRHRGARRSAGWRSSLSVSRAQTRRKHRGCPRLLVRGRRDQVCHSHIVGRTHSQGNETLEGGETVEFIGRSCEWNMICRDRPTVSSSSPAWTSSHPACALFRNAGETDDVVS